MQFQTKNKQPESIDTAKEDHKIFLEMIALKIRISKEETPAQREIAYRHLAYVNPRFFEEKIVANEYIKYYLNKYKDKIDRAKVIKKAIENGEVVDPIEDKSLSRYKRLIEVSDNFFKQQEKERRIYEMRYSSSDINIDKNKSESDKSRETVDGNGSKNSSNINSIDPKDDPFDPSNYIYDSTDSQKNECDLKKTEQNKNNCSNKDSKNNNKSSNNKIEKDNNPECNPKNNYVQKKRKSYEIKCKCYDCCNEKKNLYNKKKNMTFSQKDNTSKKNIKSNNSYSPVENQVQEIIKTPQYENYIVEFQKIEETPFSESKSPKNENKADNTIQKIREITKTPKYIYDNDKEIKLDKTNKDKNICESNKLDYKIPKSPELHHNKNYDLNVISTKNDKPTCTKPKIVPITEKKKNTSLRPQNNRYCLKSLSKKIEAKDLGIKKKDLIEYLNKKSKIYYKLKQHCFYPLISNPKYDVVNYIPQRVKLLPSVFFEFLLKGEYIVYNGIFYHRNLKGRLRIENGGREWRKNGIYKSGELMEKEENDRKVMVEKKKIATEFFREKFRELEDEEKNNVRIENEKIRENQKLEDNKNNDIKDEKRRKNSWEEDFIDKTDLDGRPMKRIKLRKHEKTKNENGFKEKLIKKNKPRKEKKLINHENIEEEHGRKRKLEIEGNLIDNMVEEENLNKRKKLEDNGSKNI